MSLCPVFRACSGLSYAQAFAGRHHQHDGHDAPRNPEHGQKSAQLVGPQGAENVADEIA